MKNKKLIGYRLKDDCKQYKQAAEGIVGYETYYGDEYDFSLPKGIESLEKAGVLDLWFEPVYEEETKAVPGKWYKSDGLPEWLIYYESNNRIYGTDAYGKWYENINQDDFGIPIRVATNKEVEDMLIKEAKRRGFKPGCKSTSVDGTENNDGLGDEWFYRPSSNSFKDSDKHMYSMFYKGKWATIIEEEPKHKTSTWYKHQKTGSIFHCTHVRKDGTLYGYGVFRDYMGDDPRWQNYKEGDVCCACNEIAAKYLVEATHGEVVYMLIEEAKRRGFKKGVKCNASIFGTEWYNNSVLPGGVWEYSGSFDQLSFGHYAIYRKGKWATIIEEPKTFQPTMQLRWRYNPNQYGKYTLEQKFTEITTGEEEWQAVPNYTPF